ncbi:hypothetical protein HC928_16475 [bacterium]|nr:hypothetical protein [bacterium]
MVHNGIVENWRILRAEIEADGTRDAVRDGHRVVAHLCAREIARGRSPVDAATDWRDSQALLAPLFHRDHIGGGSVVGLRVA